MGLERDLDKFHHNMNAVVDYLETIAGALETISVSLQQMVPGERDDRNYFNQTEVFQGPLVDLTYTKAEPEPAPTVTVYTDDAQAMGQALRLYGPNVASVTNSRGKDLLRWCVRNGVSPTLVVVGPDGKMVVDAAIMQQYAAGSIDPNENRSPNG